MGLTSLQLLGEPNSVTTTDALERLRCTSALLSCTPTISARLLQGDRVVVEVMRQPHPIRDHAVLPTCWFRAFLAEAVRNGPPAEGPDRYRFERLLASRIELGVRDGTVLLPANVLRVEASSWLHLLAVGAPAELVRPIAVAAADEAGVPATLGAGDFPLELHADRDLDVTVLALGSTRIDSESEVAAEVLRSVAMRVAIERLERDLAAIADHPAGGADDRTGAHRPER